MREGGREGGHNLFPSRVVAMALWQGKADSACVDFPAPITRPLTGIIAGATVGAFVVVMVIVVLVVVALFIKCTRRRKGK